MEKVDQLYNDDDGNNYSDDGDECIMDDDDAKKQAGPNLEQIDQLHNLQLCVHDQPRPFIDFSISSKSEQSEQVRNGDKHHFMFNMKIVHITHCITHETMFLSKNETKLYFVP